MIGPVAQASCLCELQTWMSALPCLDETMADGQGRQFVADVGIQGPI